MFSNNRPRLCGRPGSPLKVVEFRTMSGDFKLQQNSASAKIFTTKKVHCSGLKEIFEGNCFLSIKYFVLVGTSEKAESFLNANSSYFSRKPERDRRTIQPQRQKRRHEGRKKTNKLISKL